MKFERKANFGLNGARVILTHIDSASRLTHAFPPVPYGTGFIIFMNNSKIVNGISNRVFIFPLYTYKVCFRSKRNLMNAICVNKIV